VLEPQLGFDSTSEVVFCAYWSDGCYTVNGSGGPSTTSD